MVPVTTDTNEQRRELDRLQAVLYPERQQLGKTEAQHPQIAACFLISSDHLLQEIRTKVAIIPKFSVIPPASWSALSQTVQCMCFLHFYFLPSPSSSSLCSHTPKATELISRWCIGQSLTCSKQTISSVQLLSYLQCVHTDSLLQYEVQKCRYNTEYKTLLYSTLVPYQYQQVCLKERPVT